MIYSIYLIVIVQALEAVDEVFMEELMFTLLIENKLTSYPQILKTKIHYNLSDSIYLIYLLILSRKFNYR